MEEFGKLHGIERWSCPTTIKRVNYDRPRVLPHRCDRVTVSGEPLD
jgi:hypothetical protein